MATINILQKNIDYNKYENNFSELKERLYPQRKTAVERLKNRKAAIMSLAAGLLLQEVIERECGISPDNLKIYTNKNGKPYIDRCYDFYFNISHSDNILVLAYGNREMGIDVEKLKEDDIAVAKRCFTADEYDYIRQNPADETKTEQEYRFCRVWTMKEAYLKYMGTGISVPLNSFNVDPLNGGVKDEDVRIITEITDNHMISICTSSDDDIHIKFVY